MDRKRLQVYLDEKVIRQMKAEASLAGYKRIGDFLTDLVANYVEQRLEQRVLVGTRR